LASPSATESHTARLGSRICSWGADRGVGRVLLSPGEIVGGMARRSIFVSASHADDLDVASDAAELGPQYVTDNRLARATIGLSACFPLRLIADFTDAFGDRPRMRGSFARKKMLAQAGKRPSRRGRSKDRPASEPAVAGAHVGELTRE
jgi:hypothetical protein